MTGPVSTGLGERACAHVAPTYTEIFAHPYAARVQTYAEDDLDAAVVAAQEQTGAPATPAHEPAMLAVCATAVRPEWRPRDAAWRGDRL